MASNSIYQFYAELEDYKPKMWRRFQVAGNITVARLGYTVMTMYEMEASHLLVIENERPFFTPSGRMSRRSELINRYDIPDEDGDWNRWNLGDDATKAKLSQLELAPPSRLVVWYDMGDDWRVQVTLEKIIDEPGMSGKNLPLVLEGKGFGIVEDCGGVYALADLAQAFKEKKGEEYEQYREWLGVDNLDLVTFNLDDMNFRLKKLPAIYAKIYEKYQMPSQADIDLIEREYLKK